MNSTSDKIKLGVLIFIGLGFAAYMFLQPEVQDALLAGQNSPALIASSTQLTLTTSSQLIVASSSKREAFTVQPIYCNAGSDVYMKHSVPATVANASLIAYASSTRDFDDKTSPRNQSAAVHGITNAGTCTVIVTEWRTL